MAKYSLLNLQFYLPRSKYNDKNPRLNNKNSTIVPYSSSHQQIADKQFLPQSNISTTH